MPLLPEDVKLRTLQWEEIVPGDERDVDVIKLYFSKKKGKGQALSIDWSKVLDVILALRFETYDLAIAKIQQDKEQVFAA
jgi:hypothetical protein